MIGFHDTYEKALEAGYEKYGLRHFVIQQITDRSVTNFVHPSTPDEPELSSSAPDALAKAFTHGIELSASPEEAYKRAMTHGTGMCRTPSKDAS